jgi:hypothetical protein
MYCNVKNSFRNVKIVRKFSVFTKKSKKYFGLFSINKMQNNAKKVSLLDTKKYFRLFSKNDLTKKRELCNKTVKKLHLRLQNEFSVRTIRIVSTY